jgi:hypothetical protein
VALVRRSATVGADPDRVLAHASRGDLDGARNAAQVLAARVRGLVERIAVADLPADELDRPDTAWQPPAGATERYHDEMGDLMDQRARTLGELAAAEPPAWALRRWGQVPDHPAARATWIEAAGEIAAYQERWATTVDLDQPTAPPISAVDKWLDYQGLRRWLDLDHNDIADMAQSWPDADRNGVDDRGQAGPDRDANVVEDALDAAMASLLVAEALLDDQDRTIDGPPAEVAVGADESTGVDVGP